MAGNAARRLEGPNYQDAESGDDSTKSRLTFQERECESFRSTSRKFQSKFYSEQISQQRSPESRKVRQQTCSKNETNQSYSTSFSIDSILKSSNDKSGKRPVNSSHNFNEERQNRSDSDEEECRDLNVTDSDVDADLDDVTEDDNDNCNSSTLTEDEDEDEVLLQRERKSAQMQSILAAKSYDNDHSPEFSIVKPFPVYTSLHASLGANGNGNAIASGAFPQTHPGEYFAIGIVARFKGPKSH
jgi:hypothetical protein